MGQSVDIMWRSSGRRISRRHQCSVDRQTHLAHRVVSVIVLCTVVARSTPLVQAAKAPAWGGKGCGACVPTCIGADAELDCGMRRLAVEYAVALLGQVRAPALGQSLSWLYVCKTCLEFTVDC
jgi:hypothetical protein